MDIKVAVYASWFIFAIWCYIVLVYAISSIWFARIKAIKTFWDFRAITIETFFFVITLIGQIFTIFLFLDSGKKLIKTGGETTTKYWILISLNFIFILCYLFFYLFFSNNLAVKFTKEKVYLIGMSVLNSAFIFVKKSPNNSVTLEYVYNQSQGKKWTEKLKFFSFFKSTKFVLDNYKTFFDPERNLSFFNIDQVSLSKEKVNKIQDKIAKDKEKPSTTSNETKKQKENI